MNERFKQPLSLEQLQQAAAHQIDDLLAGQEPVPDSAGLLTFGSVDTKDGATLTISRTLHLGSSAEYRISNRSPADENDIITTWDYSWGEGRDTISMCRRTYRQDRYLGALSGKLRFLAPIPITPEGAQRRLPEFFDNYRAALNR